MITFFLSTVCVQILYNVHVFCNTMYILMLAQGFFNWWLKYDYFFLKMRFNLCNNYICTNSTIERESTERRYTVHVHQMYRIAGNFRGVKYSLFSWAG